MECAGKGSRTPCSGPPVRRCQRCQAVAYCSLSHQVLHRSAHKRECERLEQQMRRADVLNDFPFTFTREATQIQGSRCSLLIRLGVHQLGMWMCECSCGGVSANRFDSPRLISSWDLSSELCPCRGPERELLQLSVFGELRALLPGVKVHIDLVGPAIPCVRDGEKIDLYTYARCNDMGCGCQYSADNYQERIKTCHSPAITLRLLAGCYHNRCEELLQDSFPHIVIAPNAGVAAYMSWLPTLEVIKKLEVPAVFSDYCEEACHLAASCIRSVTGNSPRIQIQMNPFRQPLCVEESALYLPCYSNCFLFGV